MLITQYALNNEGMQKLTTPQNHDAFLVARVTEELSRRDRRYCTVVIR